MIGKLVAVAGHAIRQAVGVVSSVAGDSARVMVYQPNTGRWMSPAPYALSRLSEPPDWPHVEKARANIRRHHGVLPCGGMFVSHVRVWPDGREPAQRAS